MKKFLLIIAVMFAGISSAMVQTQKGEMGAGLNLLYGTEIKNLGIGAKYRYSISDEFRAEATLDYYFKHDHCTMLDGNINFEYLLPINDTNFYTYPILGFGLGNHHFSAGGDNAKLVENTFIAGFNTGWGAEYYVTDKAALTVEAKYQFFNKNCTQLCIGVGLVHKF